MATNALSNTELQALLQYQIQPGHKVLSLYLEIDQSRPANRNHGYIRTLKDLLRSSEQRLEKDAERAELQRSANRILTAVAGLDARGRSLVMLSGASRDFFWSRELSILLPSLVRWDEKPYLRPLIEAIDEYERYAVVVVDRQRARLFTLYLGQIEEEQDLLSPEKRKHFKKTGRDTVQSQPNFQRHEDEHTAHHLKEVAAALELVAGRNGFDRLILGGPREITQGLRGVLPKKLQELIVREIPLAIETGDRAVLKETMAIEEEVERDTETRLVEELITAGHKENQGALGAQPTLQAMRQGRILRLVYVFDLALPGSQCANCGSLFEGRPSGCVYCSGSLKPVADIVAQLSDQVVESGGRAENVRGPAADRLREAGRIGAFLRF
jgi:peptide chain release factor subunit 1